MVDKNATLRKTEDDQAQEDDARSQLSQVSDLWETSGVRMSAVCLNVLQDISDAASQYSSLDHLTADRTKKTDQERKKKSFDFFNIKRKRKSKKKSKDEGKAQVGQSALVPSNTDEKRRNEKLDHMPEERLEHKFDHGEKHFDISPDKCPILPSKKENTDISANQKGNSISAAEAVKSKTFLKAKQNTLPKVEPKEQKGNQLQRPWKRLETSIQKMITTVSQKFPTSEEPAVRRRKDDNDVKIPKSRAIRSESDNIEFKASKDETFDTTRSVKRDNPIKKNEINEVQQTPLDMKSSITHQESQNSISRGRPQKRSIENYRREKSAEAPTTRGPERKIRRRALSREWVVVKTITTEHTTIFSPNKGKHHLEKMPREKATSSPLLDGTNYFSPETGTSNKTPSARKEKASDLQVDDKHLEDLVSSEVKSNNNQASPKDFLRSLPSGPSPQTDTDESTLHAPNTSNFIPQSFAQSKNLPNANSLLAIKNNPFHFASASKTKLLYSSEPELEVNSIPSASFKEDTYFKSSFATELDESPRSTCLATSIAAKHITSLSFSNPNHFYQETANKESIHLNLCPNVNDIRETYTSSMSDEGYNGGMIPNRIWTDEDQKQAVEVTNEVKFLERNATSPEASKPRWTKRKHVIRIRAGNLSLTNDSNDSTNETTPELVNLPQSFYDRDWPGESGQPKIERNRVRLHSPKLNRRGSFSPRLTRHGSSSPRISRTSSSPRTKRTSCSPKPARTGTSPRLRKPRWIARKPATRGDRQSSAIISSTDHCSGAILKLREEGNDESSFYQGGIGIRNEGAVGDQHIEVWAENSSASKLRWTKRKPAARGKTRALVGINSSMMQMYDSSSDTSSTNAPEFRDHKVRQDLKKTYRSDDSSLVDAEDTKKNEEFYGSSMIFPDDKLSFGIEGAKNALGQAETQALVGRNRIYSIEDGRNKNESALSDQIRRRGELFFDKNRNISQPCKNNITDNWSGLQSFDATPTMSNSEDEGILFWNRGVDSDQSSVSSQGYFTQNQPFEVSYKAAAAFDANSDGNENSFFWNAQINDDPSDCDTISNKDEMNGYDDHQNNDESSCFGGNQDGVDVEYFADIDAEGPAFPDGTGEIPFARIWTGYSTANEGTTSTNPAINVVQPSDRTWSSYSTARDNAESHRKLVVTKPNSSKVNSESLNESMKRLTKPNTSDNLKPTKQSEISLQDSTNTEQSKHDVKDHELQVKEGKLLPRVKDSTGDSGESIQGQGYSIHPYLGDHVSQSREENTGVENVSEADNGLLSLKDRAKLGCKNDRLLMHESNLKETQLEEIFVEPAITKKSYSTPNSNNEEFYSRQKDLSESINNKSVDLSDVVPVYQSNTTGVTCSIENDTKIRRSLHFPGHESMMTGTKQQTVHDQESSTDQIDATSQSINQRTIILPTDSKSLESRSSNRSALNRRVLSDEDRSSPMLTTRRFHVDLPYSDSGYSETEAETLSPCSFRSSISQAETVTEEVYSESLTDDDSRFSFSLADDVYDKCLFASITGFDPQSNAYIVQDSIMPFDHDEKISKSQEALQDIGENQAYKSVFYSDSTDTRGEDITIRLSKNQPREVDLAVDFDESVPHLPVFQSKYPDLNDFKSVSRESEKETRYTVSQLKIGFRKVGPSINDDKASVDVEAGLPEDAFATKRLEGEELNRVYKQDGMATELSIPDNCGKPLTDSELISSKINAVTENGYLAQKNRNETSGGIHQLRCITTDSASSVSSGDDTVLDTEITSSQYIDELERNIQGKGKILNEDELQKGGFSGAENGEELSLNSANKTVCDRLAFPTKHLNESGLRVDGGRIFKMANMTDIIPDKADKTLKDVGRHFTRSTFLIPEEQSGLQRNDLQVGIPDFAEENISHSVISGGNVQTVNCQNAPKEDRICHQQDSKSKSESSLKSISRAKELETDLELLTWYEYAELYSVYRQFANGSSDSLLPSAWIWNSSRYATNYRSNAKKRTALHYPDPHQCRSYSCPLVSEVFVLVRERKGRPHHKSASILERRFKAGSEGHSVIMKNSAHGEPSLAMTESYKMHDMPKELVVETIQKTDNSKQMAEQSSIAAAYGKEDSTETKFADSVVQQQNLWTKTEISSDVVPLSTPSDNLSINSSAAEHDDNSQDILKEKECLESTTLFIDQKNSDAKSNPTSKGKSKRKRKTEKKENPQPFIGLKGETCSASQSPQKNAGKHENNMSHVICREASELSGTECSVIKGTNVSSLEHGTLEGKCAEANLSIEKYTSSIQSGMSAAGSSSVGPQRNVETKQLYLQTEVSYSQIDAIKLSQINLSVHEVVESESESAESSAETDSTTTGVYLSDDTTDSINKSGNLRQRSHHNETDNEDRIADNVANVEATSSDVVVSEQVQSNRNKAAIIALLTASIAGLVSLILLLYITIHDSEHELLNLRS